jgi:hypothetical protein
VGIGVGDQRPFAHHPQRLVEVAFVPACGRPCSSPVFRRRCRSPGPLDRRESATRETLVIEDRPKSEDARRLS